MWHGKSPYTYVVYDEEGLYAFEGRRKDVAEYLGVSPLQVYRAAVEGMRVKKRYTVEQIEEKEIKIEEN